MKYVFLSSLIFISNAFSQEITLKDAALKAAAESESVKMAVYGEEAARASLKEARSRSLGKISLKTTYTNGDEPVYAFAQTLRQGKFSMASMASVNNPPSIENTEIALEGGIPLFTGFLLSNYEKMAELGGKAAKNYYERTVSGVKFNSAYLYLTAMLRAELLKEIDHTLSSSKEELAAADKLNKSGMIPGSDYYAALAIYSGLENFRNSLEGDFKNDLKKLSAEISADPSSLKLSGSLSTPLNENPNCDNLRSEISNRKDLLAYKAVSDISLLNASVEKNSILPQVEAFGAFYGNSGAINSMKTSGIYGLRMTLPLGDPSYFARKEKSMALARGAGEDYAAKVKKAATELDVSCRDYYSALNSAKLSQDTSEKAKQSLELFRPLYRQGKQSIMEVLRAENSFFQARASYYEAVYKTHLFYLQTLFYAEKLDDSALERVENNLKKNWRK